MTKTSLSSSCRRWYVLLKEQTPKGKSLVLHSDPTGSRRTEGGQEDESGGQLLTVHTRTRAGRTNTRTEETGDGWSRAFRRTSDRYEGEVSNISSEVVEYKYTKYIY